jgi:hypothetical protein
MWRSEMNIAIMQCENNENESWRNNNGVSGVSVRKWRNGGENNQYQRIIIGGNESKYHGENTSKRRLYQYRNVARWHVMKIISESISWPVWWVRPLGWRSSRNVSWHGNNQWRSGIENNESSVKTKAALNIKLWKYRHRNSSA